MHVSSSSLSVSDHPHISQSALLKAWLQVGAQSFGGGMSTTTLIQRVFVQQTGWLTDSEFIRTNAISQMAPGINLLSITILIGVRLGGALGIFTSLLGLLVPSAAITVLMTVFYADVRRQAWVREALHGIVPATIGVGLWTGFLLARALLAEVRVSRAKAGTVAAVFVMAGSALLVARGVPVIVALCGGGVLMAIVRAVSHRSPTSEAAVEAAALDEADAEEER